MDTRQAVQGTPSILGIPNETGLGGRTLVSLTGLMELYGFSESWWRKRLVEGLPHRKWGARLRFDPDDVIEWLDGHYE